jgi:flagellar hook-associated protein 3 FlgL
MIRVATSTLFAQGVFNLQTRQAELVKLQDQIATGRRVRTPSDDPVSAARSLEVEQSRAVNEQYIRNSDSAVSALSESENILTSVTLLLQDVKTIAVNAGDGALSDRELRTLADDLRARRQELIGLANATDGNGQYLFSGYRGSTRPFSETAPGVVSYAGDQGARLIQISASRQVAISDAGSDVFQTIKNGNTTFATAAGAANLGTGIVSPGTVTDPVAWNAAGNPADFSVVFHVDSTVNPPVTTYDIIDNVNNVSLTTGAAPAAGPYLRTYSENGTISLSRQVPPDTNPAAFDFGAELSIQGQPASGDRFTVRASTNEDLFETLQNLITALETAAPAGATGNVALSNRLNTALSNLDNGLDNLLRVRAAIGARLREVEATQSSQGDLVVQYDAALSKLRDLDYAAAITDLTRNQFTYEAAQQSFIRVQSLSLFNLL